MAWKDVRIQGKFVIGFGFIIILLIAMSITSIINIQRIVDNADQVIQGNKLKSTIIQREVDHLNWEAQLSEFLNDQDATELMVQTDPTKCAFGKWYYGEGRKEAEALVPGLALALRDVESYHNDLHQSAIRIEENHSTVDPQLGSFLRDKKSDHITWKLNLLDYVTDHTISENPVETDHTKCGLGLWLYSNEMERLVSEHNELTGIFRELVNVHEVMHGDAILIDEMVQDDKYEEALAFFHGQLEQDLEETLSYLNQIINWHDEEMSRLYKTREIFASETTPALKGVQDQFSEMINQVNTGIMTEDVMLESGRDASLLLLIVSIAIVVISIIMAFALSRAIIRPILKCVNFADQISTGDLAATLDIQQKDQIGQLCDSLRKVLGGFQDKAAIVERFAEGDLTPEIITLSDKDGLGISLGRMKTDLNSLIGQIVSAVDQISSGAEQIAQASQNLSEGAATQASSTEQVSVMVNEISGQAAQNSDNASQAKSISEKATMDAEEGNQNMDTVVTLMDKINSGADETKKIVKVIDDIAFQINLLALNANVEAARAGKYGKGFAVVADEVRNLAVKSAQAAKETSERVEESISNIRNGAEAVQVSATQLEEIVKGSRQVSDILEEIAAASKNQDDGISQATSGLDQIDKITQENTGNAEETASASEELSSQSMQLKGLVDRFKLDNGDQMERRGPARQLTFRKPAVTESKPTRKEKPAPVEPEVTHSTGIKPVNPSDVISLDDNDFDQF